MKEYSNKIEIAPIDDIISIAGNVINMVAGKNMIIVYSNNEILPNEQPGEKDGLSYYSQILNVITDKLENTILSNFLDRKVVVKLFSSDDQEILLGTLENPARCNALPSLNADTLKITCESPYPMLS